MADRKPAARYVDQPNYTVKAAAIRTGLTTRTIERWLTDGMEHRLVAGKIVIDHPELLKWLRTKSINNPARKRYKETG